MPLPFLDISLAAAICGGIQFQVPSAAAPFSDSNRTAGKHPKLAL
jgi:hypothetical protein